MGKFIQINFTARSKDYIATLLSTPEQDEQWLIDRDESQWSDLDPNQKNESIHLYHLKEAALDLLCEREYIEHEDADADHWEISQNPKDHLIYFLKRNEETLVIQLNPEASRKADQILFPQFG
jgi:hypothetical protein